MSKIISSSKKNFFAMLTSNLAKIFYIFISSRIIVLFFGFLGNSIYAKNRDIQHAFCQWDCGWYLSLIKNGYDLIPHAHPDGNAANWAFFPVFPKTIAFISHTFSFSPLNTAFLLNNIVFFFGLYFLFLYVKKEFEENIAMTTVILMAFSPYSLYFSVPYTESIFSLLLILVFYFSINGKWIYAGLFAALLSGTKIVGVMIVFPMLVIAIRQFGFKNLLSFKTEDSYKVLLSLLVAPLGLFMYMHYLYLKVGDAFAFKNIQIAWGREIGNPFAILYNGLEQAWNSYAYYAALMTLLGVLLTFILLYKKRYPEFIFMLIVIFIPLSTSLTTMPRYIFIIFPMYIAFSLIIYKYDLLKQFVLLFFSAALSFMAISLVVGKGYMV